MIHATPSVPETLYRHQLVRRAGMLADRVYGELQREGLIYTRAGVLDMTRRPVHRLPAVEQIVVHIGGARAW